MIVFHCDVRLIMPVHTAAPHITAFALLAALLAGPGKVVYGTYLRLAIFLCALRNAEPRHQERLAGVGAGCRHGLGHPAFLPIIHSDAVQGILILVAAQAFE